MTRHPADSPDSVPGATGQVDLWSRLTVGLATLHTEIIRTGGNRVGRWCGLTWRPVPVIAGVGGISAGRALGRRGRSKPPTCLAVVGGNSSDGSRQGRGGRQPGTTTPPPGAGVGIGSGTGTGTGTDDPTEPTESTGPTDDTPTLDSHNNHYNDAHKNFGQDEPGVDVDVADLVDRVKNGEREAFGALYDQYAELVYRFVFYRVGSIQLTEDIVSETFLKALRHIGSFTWQGPDIGAWFITIARHLVIDHVRSSKTRLEFPTEDILTAAETHSDGTDNGPEDTVLTMLRNRTLLEAVRALSPDQQECVVLRFLEGLSLRETALAMDRKENAVKALQLRAVRALARHLPPPSELI